MIMEAALGRRGREKKESTEKKMEGEGNGEGGREGFVLLTLTTEKDTICKGLQAASEARKGGESDSFEL